MVMIPSMIYQPSINPPCSIVIILGRMDFNLLVRIFVMILYTVLHKLIGLKFISLVVPWNLGIRAIKMVSISLIGLHDPEIPIPLW